MKLTLAYASLRFDPAVPAWVLGVLAALCVAALAPALIRRARGALWRTLAFAVLLLWLAGPRLVEETRDSLPDIGLIVVDKTDSMRVGERSAARDAAAAELAQQASRLPDLEMRTVVVPEGGRDGTALFAAIDGALADVPRARLAGILALTDGQVHDTPATPLPAPLHVLIPASGEQTDRRIRIVEAPSFGIVGRAVTVRLAVDDLGVRPGNTMARLTVRRDGDPPQTQSVPVDQETSIDIPITRAGPVVVELSADPLPGEVSTLNNRAVVTINGVRDRLRVLLVSGEPHLGERTWRRLLKADPAVDLVHFTILRPPDRDDMTPTNELSLIAFPVRELFQVKIRDFDLIILDRFSNRNSILPPLYLRNIADYVRGGGALLLSAGPEFAGRYSLAATNLGSVLPVAPPLGAEPGFAVVDGPFRPAVTALGERHPVTESLADAGQWGDWYRYIGASATGGQELMSAGDGAPLLLLNRVGEGRVALLLSDQIWLWSRGHEGGGPQAELLRRIAHWAMKEPALEEETLRATIEHNSMHIERRSLQELGRVGVTVTSPTGQVTRLDLTPSQPGLWQADLDAAEPGVWQVADGEHTVYVAAANANPREIADLRATAAVLSPLARASGGSVRFIGGSPSELRLPELRRTGSGREAAGSSWVGLPRRNDHIVTGVRAVPLLPPWAALPLLLGLVLVAWRREGSG
ncbi:MAG: hypothetical protein RQ966_07540 [Acetobacteraceae bacterium]|nr:hypothetical protein [Acetobacteraceae bacterium]